MTVLADTSIQALASRCGFDAALISSHSVDLRLGGQIKAWPPPNVTFSARDLRPETARRELAGLEALPPRVFALEPGERFTFLPGWFYLAQSAEYLHLPDDVAGEVALKSSTARRGLNHLTACWIEPSFAGNITFELVAYRPVTATVGEPLMQLKLLRAEVARVPYRDRGRYMYQTGATEARPGGRPADPVEEVAC